MANERIEFASWLIWLATSYLVCASLIIGAAYLFRWLCY